MESTQSGRSLLNSAELNRREMLQSSLAALGTGWLMNELTQQSVAAETGYRLAKFSVDATPPIGHPCCGGWIADIKQIDDPYFANGIILLGSDKPIVIVAVDWTGILNDSYLQLTRAIAAAVGTDPNRVAVQCVHPHNAPFADGSAQKLLAKAMGAPTTLLLDYFDQFTEKVAAAVKHSLASAQPVTHIGTGQAKVDKVAANRRLKDEQGKLYGMRGSACRDPKLQALPEGLIDPFLKTVSFWNGEQALAALHYYACHPMSYYGDGRGTPDFCALARQKLAAEDPSVTHLYFDGCGGNIAAGKYNDGSPEMRPVLVQRIYDGLRGAWQTQQKTPVSQIVWRSEPVKFNPRAELSHQPDELKKILADSNAGGSYRGRAAMELAWWDRIDRPIEFTCLDLGVAQILHLPGEPFIEYQLHAQSLRQGGFVCAAGYGDGGTWYIPTAAAYPEGGYEVSVSWIAPDSEEKIHAAFKKLLG